MPLGTTGPQSTSSLPVRRPTKRCVHKFRQGECKICNKTSSEIVKNKLVPAVRPHGEVVPNGFRHPSSRDGEVQFSYNSGARLVKDCKTAGYHFESAWNQTSHLKSE